MLLSQQYFKGGEYTESLGVLFSADDAQINGNMGRQAKSRYIDACGLITMAKIWSFFSIQNRATRNMVRPS